MPHNWSGRHELCCQPRPPPQVHATLPHPQFHIPACAMTSWVCRCHGSADVIGLPLPHAGPLTLWDPLLQHRGLRLSVHLDFSTSRSFGRGHTPSLASPWSPAQSGLRRCPEEDDPSGPRDLVSGTLVGDPDELFPLTAALLCSQGRGQRSQPSPCSQGSQSWPLLSASAPTPPTVVPDRFGTNPGGNEKPTSRRGRVWN